MKDWSCRSNVSTFLKMRSWHYFAATDLLATYFALSKSWLADPHFHFHIKLYMHFHNPGHCSSFLYLLIHQWICIPLHLHNSCDFEDNYLKSNILFCLFPVLLAFGSFFYCCSRTAILLYWNLLSDAICFVRCGTFSCIPPLPSPTLCASALYVVSLNCDRLTIWGAAKLAQKRLSKEEYNLSQIMIT